VAAFGRKPVIESDWGIVRRSAEALPRNNPTVTPDSRKAEADSRTLVEHSRMTVENSRTVEENRLKPEEQAFLEGVPKVFVSDCV
jgi:hypothetical protein